VLLRLREGRLGKEYNVSLTGRRTAARDPWVWGQGALGLLVVGGVPLLAARLETAEPTGLARWAGIVGLAAGCLMMLAGAATLGPNLTPATQPLPHGTLVTAGPYRLVRHPIYFGVVLVFAGYAMLRGGWWFGGAVFILSLAYFERKARVEERWMEERDPRYRDYRARVPRILPGGWR